MSETNSEKKKTGGLSAEKREDLWALIIAAIVLLVCMAAPEQVYRLFKNILYLF